MKNYFSQLHTRDKYTWGIRSFFRYSYLPSSLKLTFDDDRQSSTPLREYQEMNVSNAYTDNSLYWMRKKNGVNYQLTGGFRGELSSVTGPYSANRSPSGVEPGKYTSDSRTVCPMEPSA